MKRRASFLPAFFALRVVLGFVVGCFFLLGIVGIVGGSTADGLIRLFYQASFEGSPVASYLVSLVAIYMLAFGVMGLFAWNNPLRHASLIYGIALLLVLRAVQKVAFLSSAQETFGASASFILLSAGGYLLIAGLLYYLIPRIK